MNSFFVFYKKEWLELVRTKKLFIFIGIFALFGMGSPLIANYMQELISASIGGDASSLVSTTTWVDSYSQFYSNLSQMGCLSIIFLFMGCVVGEKQSGSAALTLTKNLSYSSFILAKFLAAAILLVLSTLLAVLLCFAYTYYIFGFAGELPYVLTGAAAFILFAFVLSSIIILSSTIAKSNTISALLSFVGFMVLIILNYLPNVGMYLPGVLLSKAVQYTTTRFIDGFWLIVISCFITIFCLLASIQILKKQEI